MHLIDQVHCHGSIDDKGKSEGKGSTLAQEALIYGDRYLFRLLTDRYHANAKLAIRPPTSCETRDSINLYTRLAYTDHQDVWFGYVFASFMLLLSTSIITMSIAKSSNALAFLFTARGI